MQTRISFMAAEKRKGASAHQCLWVVNVSGGSAIVSLPQVGEFVEFGTATYAVVNRHFRYLENETHITLYVDYIKE